MSSNQTAKIIRYALRWIPDKEYIQINYFAHFHHFADLHHPKTYNEKLNWLKLHDRKPYYVNVVDKHQAKTLISNMIGEEYTIPTLGLWQHFDEIDFSLLPNQFILKCTHDSEGIVIVKDINEFDRSQARKKIETALKHNFYYYGREWPYKNVHPAIIAEPYLEDSTDGELRDYKFFCFDGNPQFMYIASGRGENKTTFDFFDLEFNHLNIMQKYPNSIKPLRKPESFDRMIQLSKTLSKDFKQDRKSTRLNSSHPTTSRMPSSA